MFSTIAKETITPKGITKIPFEALAEDIQSVVYKYANTHNLVTSGDVGVKADDYYFMIYVNDLYKGMYEIKIEL